MNVRWLIIFLLLVASLRAATPDPVIVFLGDSLTAGFGLENPLAEAYPALIQEKVVAAGLPHRVVNAGISGDTTAGGLRRLNWILRQRVDVLVIALGGNDGLRGVDPAVTRANLQGIIDRARQRYPEVRLILAGMQMPTNMNENFTRVYRDIFPALAESNRIALIPFLLEGVGADPALNQPDLIHPTAEGQRRIADNVWPWLKTVL